ncbi:Uncharacterised protein [Chlamydia trachomatis]|nr:Uncharacterised protein [Chlamydia trachomatis]
MAFARASAAAAASQAAAPAFSAAAAATVSATAAAVKSAVALSSLRKASVVSEFPRRLVNSPPLRIIGVSSIGESTANTVDPTKNAADTDPNPKADLRKKYFTFFSFSIFSPFLILICQHILKSRQI